MIKYISLLIVVTHVAYADSQDGVYSSKYNYWNDLTGARGIFQIEWMIKDGEVVWESVCENYYKESSAYKGCREAAAILFSGKCMQGDLTFCKK